MFSYQAKTPGPNKGYLYRCFCHRAQTRLLMGIAFVLSLAVVTVEFCVMTAELLSRPQELSLHLSGRLALHLEDVDQPPKQAPDFLNSLSHLSPHNEYHEMQRKRYSLNELKTILSNTKARLNNDDPLSSNEFSSNNEQNVRGARSGEMETSTTEKIQDKNVDIIMAASTNNVLGLDPPTASIANNDQQQLPIHDKLNLQNDEREIPTIGNILDSNSTIAAVSTHDVPGIDPPTQTIASLERLPLHKSITRENKVNPTISQNNLNQPLGSHVSDQSGLNNQLTKQQSSKWKVGPSKKKSSSKQFELPRDYPLFDSPYPPPLMDGHLCRDSLCSEFLQSLTLYTYKTYLAKLRSVSGAKPGPCHFINGTRRAAVALASFPGSGNTWVRGLLEKATGICTGAIYCDKTIRASGMNGETIRSGAVIAVKTHKSRKVVWTEVNSPQILNNGKVPAYGSVILTVRNPYRALIAEWNRINAATHMAHTNGSNKHIGSTGQEQFGENGGWKSFIKRKLPVWQAYFQEWVVEGHRNNKSVLVVRYEDLKQDTFTQVKRMLDFLHFGYREDELRQRMAADFSTFQRKHHEIFEHFTREQRQIVDSGISISIDYLMKYNNGDTLRLEDYLGTVA